MEMMKKPEETSAIILAGGRSSRMGSCKAELLWEGKTLIEHQVGKMRELGIKDIIISGYSVPIEGTRFVPDKYPGKGPLGGIHAGLSAAENAHCLVTGVDTPLVPVETLAGLVNAHAGFSDSITVLSHGDKIEPIMAVYESRLSGICEQILMTEDTSIRALLNKVGYSRFQYTGDEFLLCDCNTPEEFAAASKIEN